jgi:hypothetical protein
MKTLTRSDGVITTGVRDRVNRTHRPHGNPVGDCWNRCGWSFPYPSRRAPGIRLCARLDVRAAQTDSRYTVETLIVVWYTRSKPGRFHSTT